ncbi:MAG: hypothetical protein GY832_34665 [Chloroflexi bacterium]|nr:hypothetical protein [Chloroflexota bacterium]
MIDQLPVEIIVILLGVGAVALLWLTMRFSKVIAFGILILGILAVAILGAASLTTQAAANYQTAKVATKAVEAARVSAVGQSVTTVLIILGAGLALGLMGTITASAVGVSGYIALRWKLAERRLLVNGQRRQALPETAEAGQVICVVDEADSVRVDLAGLNLAEWGW